MLLWVNNHYSDFERDADMENYLETFEKGLEQQVNRRNVPCLDCVPSCVPSLNIHLHVVSQITLRFPICFLLV